jgi:hypothetical protein
MTAEELARALLALDKMIVEARERLLEALRGEQWLEAGEKEAYLAGLTQAREFFV